MFAKIEIETESEMGQLQGQVYPFLFYAREKTN